MLGRGVGLVALVERWRFRSSADEPGMRGQAKADETCWLAQVGLFDEARRFRGLGWEAREHLNAQDAWVRFTEAVHVADAIDTFLAVLEADRRLAGLAGDCRGELDLLLVLADLCEDLALPHAAAEARYYHSTAGGRWRGEPGRCPWHEVSRFSF
jgi:hypothetical protein